MTQQNQARHDSGRQADAIRNSWEFYVLKSAIGETPALSLLENQVDYRNPSLMDVKQDGLDFRNGYRLD